MNRPRITPSVIPNLFTAMNMFCGFYSLVSAAAGNYYYAAWLIVGGAIFDALDGLVARLTNSSSELGVELDSLSDVVTFGAAPSFLLYSTYFSEFGVFGIILASLPLIAGGFRLARFNVQLVGFEKSFFIGLPIPSCASTIASFVLAFYNEGYTENISKIIIPMIVILSYLMVSNIRYETFPKLTWKSIKARPFKLLFIIAAIVLLIFTQAKGLFFIFVFMILFGIFRHVFILFNSKESD